MKSNYKTLGEYIIEINERNSDLSINKLIGVSMEKTLITSVANIIGTDMSVYKTLKKGEFACKLMSVGRDEKLPVDLYLEKENAIVSSAYYVFKSKNENILNSKYLLMWLCRPENDRYIGYVSGGDVRGGISWKTFCEIPIKIPSIEKQREIVKEYDIFQNEINLNKELIAKLEETIQVIYKQWFIDFEFPNDNGLPYKSSGGEMVFCNELNKEIPKNWEYSSLGNIVETINGFAFDSNDFKIKGKYPIIKIKNIKHPFVYIQDDTQYFNKKISENLYRIIVKKGDVLITMTGSGANQINSAVGQVAKYYYDSDSLLNQRVCKLKPLSTFFKEYIYQFIASNDIQTELLNGSTGSANQANISPDQIKKLKILIPNEEILINFQSIATVFDNSKSFQSIIKLEEIKQLLLSKMATIGN